ncbi:MAG: putative lipid II flippase FtsW [Sarcina sp.]
MRGFFKKIFGDGRKGTIDYYLLSVIIILLAIGLVMVYSASSYKSMLEKGNSMSYAFKQGAFAILGLFTMWLMTKYDHRKLKKFCPYLIIGIVILLGIILLAAAGVLPEKIAPNINGARRWIYIGPISFQPSELAKYTVVLYLAIYLSNKGEKIKKFWTGIVPGLLVVGLIAGMVLAGKSMSITMVILLTAFFMLIVAGMKFSHILVFLGGGAALVTALIKLAPYRMLRFESYKNPWLFPKKEGYQLIQSFLSLGAGGLTGLGLGKSRQKTMYMPEPHNDFIFAIIAEELGLLGCLFIISLFIFFIYRGVLIAFGARDTYGMLLAMGITSIIAIQTIINIAVVTGSMPTTGVPLPFISYGGTSLVINLAAMGVLLNISRSSKKSFKAV